jgi:hypothetical protein
MGLWAIPLFNSSWSALTRNRDEGRDRNAIEDAVAIAHSVVVDKHHGCIAVDTELAKARPSPSASRSTASPTPPTLTPTDCSTPPRRCLLHIQLDLDCQDAHVGYHNVRALDEPTRAHNLLSFMTGVFTPGCTPDLRP